MTKLMKRILTLVCALMALNTALACTNFIITRGASADGSNMISYSADSHQLYGALYKYNATGKYRAGDMIKIHEWDTGRYLGEIPQAPVTYSTVGNMNEHQLIIAETTYGGRPELETGKGIMDYGSLIYVALQRARTAREAIEVIVDLANTYGYASSGESFSIADTKEAWIMELIGKGERDKGIVWVARRIPDGMVCAHANQARITTFPLDDPENCLYAPDVISFAREMGYFNGADEEFSFSDAYAPLDFSAMRACEARVWSFYNKITSGMDKYLDFAMGHNPNNRMPLWVKPDAKVSLKQTMDCMRDHYEGTPMDMTRPEDAGTGGVGMAYRWRPMNFEVDGVKYLNERAIATQQTGFWFVAQSREWLPDPVGGVLWFGVDDAATSPLTPIYCGVSKVPDCFSTENGSMLEYSDKSAFWLVNRVANFAYLRYNRIAGDIRKVIDEWENERIAEVAEIDAKAAAKFERRPKRAIRYTTKYSIRTAEKLFAKWQNLDKYLLVKYVDGNIKAETEDGFKNNGHDPRIPGDIIFEGYGEAWKRAVAASDKNGTLRVVEY